MLQITVSTGLGTLKCSKLHHMLVLEHANAANYDISKGLVDHRTIGPTPHLYNKKHGTLSLSHAKKREAWKSRVASILLGTVESLNGTVHRGGSARC